MDKIVRSLQITICFERDKRFSVGNMATAVKELGLDQKVPEAIIRKVDEEMVEKYCEGMHARGNGKNRYHVLAV